MTSTPPKISLIDLCVDGPIADLLKAKDGYLQIDNALLKSLCDEIMSYHSTFNWNAYNTVRSGNLEPEDVPGYQELRKMPPHPRPFASWLEFSVQHYGGLSDLEREPKDYYIPYFVEHMYRPDNVDNINNDRIIFETKGEIKTLEEARKYVSVAKQYTVHFVFVFQCRDIICQWTKERNDGSRMTMEEWCTKEGFDFCYAGQEEAYRNSDRYKLLVKTVGKGCKDFKTELAEKRARAEARRKSKAR